MHNYLIPLGGVLTASGLLTMLYQGWTGPNGVHLSEQISNLGFSAVSEIAVTQAGIIAFVLILTGLGMMVYGNATAWKATNGY